jgi:Winged helix DNA-binding domain
VGERVLTTRELNRALLARQLLLDRADLPLIRARRTQVLPEAYRSRIFATSMPRSVPTFLMDGQVAGTWRYTDGHVETSAFHDLAAAARRELAAERLVAFHGDQLRQPDVRAGVHESAQLRELALPVVAGRQGQFVRPSVAHREGEQDGEAEKDDPCGHGRKSSPM